MNELTRAQAVQDKLDTLYREAAAYRLSRPVRPRLAWLDRWRWPLVWRALLWR